MEEFVGEEEDFVDVGLDKPVKVDEGWGYQGLVQLTTL